MTIYLSGPMTGRPNHNAAEFARFAALYRAEGFTVLSPPELDNGDFSKPYEDYIRRDVRVFLEQKVDRVYMLPGWQKSRGANLEKHLADMLKIAVYDAETGELFTESILQEAQRLVHGDRGDNYGHPYDDFGRTVGMLNALLVDKLSAPLDQRDLAMIMVCVKLSRERNKPKRDNRVDLAGYAETLDMVMEEEVRRGKSSA